MGGTAFIEFDKLGVSLIIFGPPYKGNHLFTYHTSGVIHSISTSWEPFSECPLVTIHWLQFTKAA